MKEQKIVMGGAYAKQYADWQVKEGGYARDMTMRDHFAALAMQAIVSTVPHLAAINPEHAAIESYEFADAMLKERNK
jgi:hypothetical protein